MITYAISNNYSSELFSHPNEFFGGVENAYNYCETDYWMNSTKEACQWFVENVPEVKEGKEENVEEVKLEGEL